MKEETEKHRDALVTKCFALFTKSKTSIVGLRWISRSPFLLEDFLIILENGNEARMQSDAISVIEKYAIIGLVHLSCRNDVVQTESIGMPLVAPSGAMSTGLFAQQQRCASNRSMFERSADGNVQIGLGNEKRGGCVSTVPCPSCQND